jgi:hypothetical protein
MRVNEICKLVVMNRELPSFDLEEDHLASGGEGLADFEHGLAESLMTIPTDEELTSAARHSLRIRSFGGMAKAYGFMGRSGSNAAYAAAKCDLVRPSASRSRSVLSMSFGRL